MPYPSKFVDSIASIPDDTKYLLMYNDSYTTDNGYPEDGHRTYSYIRTVSFNSEELMLAWINYEITPKQWGSARNPKDILIVPIEAVKRVKTEVSISVD